MENTKINELEKWINQAKELQERQAKYIAELELENLELKGDVSKLRQTIRGEIDSLRTQIKGVWSEQYSENHNNTPRSLIQWAYGIYSQVNGKEVCYGTTDTENSAIKLCEDMVEQGLGKGFYYRKVCDRKEN